MVRAERERDLGQRGRVQVLGRLDGGLGTRLGGGRVRVDSSHSSGASEVRRVGRVRMGRSRIEVNRQVGESAGKGRRAAAASTASTAFARAGEPRSLLPSNSSSAASQALPNPAASLRPTRRRPQTRPDLSSAGRSKLASMRAVRRDDHAAPAPVQRRPLARTLTALRGGRGFITSRGHCALKGGRGYNREGAVGRCMRAAGAKGNTGKKRSVRAASGPRRAKP